MAKALTALSVEAAKKDPNKRREIPDAGLQGLYLVIQPSGAKAWALRYRFAGKPAKLTLGRWPIMGLSDARRVAADALGQIEAGQNPAADKKATKAAKLEAQLSERDLVRTLLTNFQKRHLSSLKSGDHAWQFLERFVLPAWGDRDIHTIAKRDLIDLLDEIADSGRKTTANRVLAHTRKFLNWCVERDVLAASPAAGVKPPAKETSRDRVLTDAEIAWFWQACGDVGQPWGPMAKMLLLTGQRLGEVAQMTDGEVTGVTWHLSSDRTKNGRAHDVPLSDAAGAVLSDVERIAGSHGFVFTTTGDSAVQGFHKGRAHIAKRMEELATDDAGQAVKIPHWGFHDLRRTAATGMARLGIPVRVTEAVLNHVSGTGSGIVAVYQVYNYADEKRDALEAWGRYVTTLIEGQTYNVIRIVARD